MKAKHNKKTSKNKEVENNKTIQYEEKYNDVILNDLVPEDRKEEFNIQENEHKKSKRAKKGGFKFNIGKKTNKNKNQNEDIENSSSKTKKSKKNNEKSQENKQSQNHKKTKQKQHNKTKGTNELNQEHKNQNKKKMSKKRKNTKNKEQDINIKETTVEDNQLNGIDNEENSNENIVYRSETTEQFEDMHEINENNSIIWCDENFDK